MKRLKTLGVIVMVLAGALAILSELDSRFVFMEATADQEVISCLIGGVGLFLVLLGAVIGPSPYRPSPPCPTNEQPGQPGNRTRNRVRHNNLNPIPAVCPNCQKTLREGSRFCTRCGTPAPAATPVPEPIPAPPLRLMPPMHTIPAPRQVRRVGWAYRLLFFILMSVLWIIGGFVIYEWRMTGHIPWPYHDQQKPPATMALPAAPQSADSPRLPVGAVREASIEQAWIAPGYAVAADGSVGINAIATIYLANSAPPGLKFVAHFWTSNTSSVRSADPAFADPNGQVATSAMILPAAGRVQAFVPISAFDMVPAGELQMQPSIFDSSNHLVQTIKPVTFMLRRSTVYITRIGLDPPPGPRATRTLKVSIAANEHGSQLLTGRVIVNFKSAGGQMIIGPRDYANSEKELTLSSEFIIPTGSDVFRIKDITINIPPGMIPPDTTAEVSLLYDESKRTIQTDQIAVAIP